MNEQQALAKMVAPGTPRQGKYRNGVIQIRLTRACDKACFGCTQGSNLRGPYDFMTPDQFEQACRSLEGYWGTIGVFGGNPAISPHFEDCCAILRKHFPQEQCGLWCNAPMGKGAAMRATFNPRISNLNVHLDRNAHDEFKRDWPESLPFGLERDSRHAPVYLAMQDLDALPSARCIDGKDQTFATRMPNTEENRWELIARCDINQHWSAMVGTFRGGIRAWFCEVAGGMASLHENDPDWPDNGMPVEKDWWRAPMTVFAAQVRQCCHRCGVPLRGYGELAQETDAHGTEQTTVTHAGIFHSKRRGRAVQIVTDVVQLGTGRLSKMTDYLGNASKI